MVWVIYKNCKINKIRRIWGVDYWWIVWWIRSKPFVDDSSPTKWHRSQCWDGGDWRKVPKIRGIVWGGTWLIYWNFIKILKIKKDGDDVLSAQFQHILKEYLLCFDKKAAEKRLAELKVHFNHEFVHQVCLLALEQMHDQMMVLADLLKVPNF